jgi:Serine-threonine protein kinase 19
MLSQLHSVFTTHTLIERELSNLISTGVIRKLLLRGSSADGKGGEVTGAGGEFGLILSSTYKSMLDLSKSDFGGFEKWVEGPGRSVLSISHSDFISQGIMEEEVKALIEAGFLTIDYSIREAGYTLSVPGVGDFIRNLRSGRKELLRALKRQPYKEMLEKVWAHWD